MSLDLTDLTGATAIQTATGWVELQPGQFKIDTIKLFGGRQTPAFVIDLPDNQQMIIPLECTLGYRGTFNLYRHPSHGIDIGAPIGAPAAVPHGERGQRASVPEFAVRR